MRYSASKKFMSFIITFALACSLATAPLIGWASERDGDAASTHEQNIAAQIETGEDTSAAPLNAVASDTPIAIIHTNDVHCDINESSATLGYAGLATQVKHAQALYGTENVALVDAGDSVQGKPVGTLSKGEDIIDIMNESGYSAATLGNHEFDYGMAQLSKLTSKAAFPYVSCNFISLATGKPVYDPYVIRTYGNTKIAYVGITTPESLTKSTPTNFQDENGNYLYGFCQDETGQALHECIQDAVDSARANGADYVVALGHLGKSDGTSAPDRWNSDAVIAETSGIDAFIDGHSHQVYNQLIKNKDGIEVPLMQTGTQLQASGMIVIDPATDTITTTINTPPVEQDAEMAAYLKVINDRLAQTLDVVIATSQVNLKAIDYDELGQWQAWAVRMRETNLGDLIADSYRSALKADIGFANGGGIRADIATGDVTYGDVISVEPYANTLSMARASGQTILDALEMSARAYPSTTGGFLQTSGLTYELRQDIPSPVVLDSVGNFAGINGDRRVQNVRVAGEPLDPNKTYTVASITYILKNGGDGYTMFKQSDPIVDEVGLDYEALITYIQHDLGGVIGSGYENEDGSGRILVKLGPDPVPTPIPTPTPVPSVDPTTASVSTLARTGDSDPQLVIAVSSLALSGFVGLVVSSALIGRTCARGRAGVSRARIRLRNAR